MKLIIRIFLILFIVSLHNLFRITRQQVIEEANRYKDYSWKVEDNNKYKRYERRRNNFIIS